MNRMSGRRTYERWAATNGVLFVSLLAACIIAGKVLW